MKSVPDATGPRQPDGGRAVGWYPDPFGRHEQRYFDGTWTAQVMTDGKRRDDPPPTGDRRVPIVDCPAPVVRHHVALAEATTDEPGGGTLRTERVVVFAVGPSDDRADYGIFDQRGRPIGAVREVEQSTPKGLLRFVRVAQLRARNLQVVDAAGSVELAVKRPLSVTDLLVRARYLIKDVDGRPLGEYVQSWSHVFEVSCQGRKVAWIQAKNFFHTKLDVVDAGNRVMARVTFRREHTVSPGPGARTYVLHFVQPLEQPLQSVLLTAPVVLDTARRYVDTFAD